MTSFGAVATSFRIGEIRFEDVVRQVSDAEQVAVNVLDRRGLERQVHLRFTEKWGGSWQRLLECPLCRRPARVLAVHDDSAACGRCRPRATAHHRHKNALAWRQEGALADEISRTVLRGTSTRGSSSTKGLARRLKKRTLAQSTQVHDEALRLIRAVDLSGLLHR